MQLVFEVFDEAIHELVQMVKLYQFLLIWSAAVAISMSLPISSSPVDLINRFFGNCKWRINNFSHKDSYFLYAGLSKSVRGCLSIWTCTIKINAHPLKTFPVTKVVLLEPGVFGKLIDALKMSTHCCIYWYIYVVNSCCFYILLWNCC